MLKKLTSILITLVLLSYTASSQWIFRSRLGFTETQYGTESRSASFTFSTPDTGYSYYNIYGTPSSGDPNEIRKSINHGGYWYDVLNNVSSDHYNFRYIESLHPDTAYIVKDDYEIYTYATFNGGAAWDMICYGGSGDINDFFLLNNRTAYLSVHHHLIRYSDGDCEILLNNYALINKMCFLDTITGMATRFDSNTQLWSLIKTTDGGRSWSSLYTSTDTLSQLIFTSELNGYIICDSSLLYTSDGGLTINRLVTPNTEKLNDLYCLNDSVIYCIGNNGEIMYSTDYGQSWILEDIGTMNLIKIKMFDIGIGYVSSSDQYLYAIGLDLTGSSQMKYQPELLITPNPSSSFITVSTDMGICNINNIKILDMNGKELPIMQTGANSFDVSDLPWGVYFLNAEVKGRVCTGKFIVK